MNYARGVMVARTRAGLSKRELAVRIGVHASYITHIEAGRKKPSLDVLEKVAGALATSMPLLMLLAADAEELVGISPDQSIALNQALSALTDPEN